MDRKPCNFDLEAWNEIDEIWAEMHKPATETKKSHIPFLVVLAVIVGLVAFDYFVVFKGLS